MLEWSTLKVISCKTVNYRTSQFIVQFENNDFDFQPGQFVTLDLPIHEKRNKRLRSYSIASPPGSKEHELIIGKVPDGLASNFMFNPATCSAGTEIKYRGPLGVFTLPSDLQKHHIWVCTGTGIAPFRSMLQHIKQEQIPFLSIDLVFGARRKEDILCQKELEDLAETYPNFNYHICLSREEYNGSRGYVHPIYQELGKKYPQEKVQFMFCGWRDMIDQARKELSELNYEKEQIDFELYG